jgi:hypothetical protein
LSDVSLDPQFVHRATARGDQQLVERQAHSTPTGRPADSAGAAA